MTRVLVPATVSEEDSQCGVYCSPVIAKAE